jgi:capsule polysaccharide export protein KpsE/RkpR
MAINTKKKEDRISFLDIFEILAKHIKLIVYATLGAAVFIVLINISSIIAPVGSFFSFMPNIYKPTVRVLVDSSFGSSPTSSLSASAITSALGIGGAQKNSTVLLLEKIMAGNKLKDAIADALDLYRIYDIPKDLMHRNTMRKIVEDKFTMSYDHVEAIGSPTVVLTLGYLDTDSVFATEALEKSTELLDDEFKNITLDKVRTKKKYLEDTIEMIQKDFGKAQQALIDFQSQYGADLKTLAQEQTNYMAQLQAEIYKQELLIRSLYLPENDPQVIQLRDQIRQKKQLINELKSGAGSFSKAPVPLSEIPDLQRQYAQLEMEAKIQNEIYTMMRKELEQTKLEEADTLPVFQLLDDFEIPQVKDGPKRAVICILFTLAAFAISILLSFILEYFKSVKERPGENAKWQNIISSLNIFKRKKPR